MVPTSHPHFKEWQVRQFSSQKLIFYLNKKNNSVVLELGCGNGWLSGTLARSLDAMVVGVDVQQTELKQAVHAFGEQQNLYFMYANILDDLFKEQSIDTIILAASVQYFKDFNKLILKLLSLLKNTGEIHIIDSPFYESLNDVLLAKQRSDRHFSLMGTPEMCDKYFHHSFQQLAQYNYQVFYNPKSVISRVKRRVLKMSQGVFPWICIRK
ncbi:class I SAM-dependent methyltransferase [Chryseolinea soli]|nr:class I SAM-dependent methyltransferase [Chryseolinea soli]